MKIPRAQIWLLLQESGKRGERTKRRSKNYTPRSRYQLTSSGSSSVSLLAWMERNEWVHTYTSHPHIYTHKQRSLLRIMYYVHLILYTNRRKKRERAAIVCIKSREQTHTHACITRVQFVHGFCMLSSCLFVCHLASFVFLGARFMWPDYACLDGRLCSGRGHVSRWQC
jgi:hypothetical protein